MPDRRLLPSHGPPARRERGIALVLALWLTILLTVIASSFAFSMRGEALAARNAVSLAQARAAADGAIERYAFELQRPRTTDAWLADGAAHRWADGEIAIAAAATDESARIDLNTGPEALLKGLLQNVGGLAAEDAQAMLDKIVDWRDPDDLRRPNGAEQSDYDAAGLKYRPPNAPFESVGELRRVLGMTEPLYARIAGSLTVYSRQAGINAATAPREVLLALPNVQPDDVDAFIAKRAEAMAAKLPIPPFPPAQPFLTGAAPTWRIHAEAKMPDGVTFARDAVVSPNTDPKRGLVALLWQEGRLTLPPPTPDAAAPIAANGTTDR